MAGENGEDVFKFLEEELEAFEKLYQELIGKIFFISYLILIKANADVWNEGFSDNPLT